MSKSPVINFYPSNPVITDAELNVNWTELQTHTADINADNVRWESIDIRQLNGAPNLVNQSFQSNGYVLGLNGTPPAIPGAEYYSYSDPILGAGTLEQPIQTTAAGVKSNLPGLGTKLLLNGANGVALQDGDIIKIDFDINCWTIGEIIKQSAGGGYILDDVSGAGTMPAWYRTYLCSTYSQGGFTGGSGMGEWFYLAYPKLNITSGAALDANFISPGFALNAASCQYPFESGFNIGLGNGNELDSTAGIDHTMIIPLHKINPGANSKPCFMPYFEGHRNTAYGSQGGVTDQFDMPPMRLSHSFTVKYNAVAGVAKTLYAIQLYISGIWRLEEKGGVLSMFRENGTCDATSFPAPTSYGLSTRIYLEQSRVGIQILRGLT